jgi:hypothetical protein
MEPFLFILLSWFINLFFVYENQGKHSFTRDDIEAVTDILLNNSKAVASNLLITFYKSNLQILINALSLNRLFIPFSQISSIEQLYLF